MKKTLFFLLAMIAVAFSSCEKVQIPPKADVIQIDYCGQQVDCYKAYAFDNKEYVALDITQSSITLQNPEFDYVINNQSSNSVGYGTYFNFYRYENNQWNKIDFKDNIGFTDIGRSLLLFTKDNGKCDMSFFIDVKKGYYIFVKEIGNAFLYDEFEVK
ncbi:MAG: hypothetical protein LBN95_07520 [Prevotellaceae bacterium]|jgi:hypothetical protein|nr:hypothetical protein [Prevotellaceae bacterium]